MGKDNFEKQLFPETPALTPYVVVERCENAVKVYGKDCVFSDRRFKKAREMWAAALYLLGRSILTGGEEYWLTPSYDEVPDVYADRFEPHPDFPGSQRVVRLCIEVTDWEAHSNETLHERILNKLKGKTYPFYFLLLVHLKRDGGVDLDEAYDEVQKHGLPIMEAWATGALANSEEYRQAVFSMGKPKIGIDFNLKNILLGNKEKQIPGALLVERQKKGTETNIYPYQYKFEFPTL